MLRRSGRVSSVRSAKLAGVAQPVARSGEVGGIGRRCQVTQRGMRALAVVVVHPTVEAFTEARSAAAFPAQ
jgi:hypothetical protein